MFVALANVVYVSMDKMVVAMMMMIFDRTSAKCYDIYINR